MRPLRMGTHDDLPAGQLRGIRIGESALVWHADGFRTLLAALHRRCLVVIGSPSVLSCPASFSPLGVVCFASSICFYRIHGHVVLFQVQLQPDDIENCWVSSSSRRSDRPGFLRLAAEDGVLAPQLISEPLISRQPTNANKTLYPTAATLQFEF